MRARRSARRGPCPARSRWCSSHPRLVTCGRRPPPRGRADSLGIDGVRGAVAWAEIDLLRRRREQRARVPAGEEDCEPGHDDADDRRDPDERQRDEVRDRKQLFHERQPAVQVARRIGTRDVEVDGLLLVDRGVLVVAVSTKSRSTTDDIGDGSRKRGERCSRLGRGRHPFSRACTGSD